MQIKLGKTVLGVLAVSILAGCSSFNPFASNPPRNPPAALVEIKPTMKVKAAWNYSIGSGATYAFSPAAAAGAVYVAAADGALARLDANNGKQVWRINTGKKLSAGVGVSADAELVAVAAEKGEVLLYDSNGKQLWKAQASSEVLAPPVIGQGVVVVRSQDNKVQAFEIENGNRRWHLQRTAPALTLRTAAGLSMDAGVVYAALPGGRLLAMSLTNGSSRWEMPVGEPRGATELERVTDVAGVPLLLGRDICAVSYQGKLACFDKLTGAARWNKDMSADVGLGGDERFVFAADENGAVSAFTRDGGRSVWRNDKLAYRRLSNPVSFGRAVVVADYQGQIHFLSREDGAFLARFAADSSPVPGVGTVAGDNLILQTQAGAVVALTTD